MNTREREVMGLSRHSRAMLLNVLWHHQGGSSAVGQPIRALLGIGEHDELTAEQVAEAKWIDAVLAAAPTPPAVASGEPTAEHWKQAVRECSVTVHSLGQPKEWIEQRAHELARSAAAKGEG